MIRQHDNGIDSESVAATRPLHRIAQGIDAIDKHGVATLKKIDRKKPAPPRVRMRDGNWASQQASNILDGGIRCAIPPYGPSEEEEVAGIQTPYTLEVQSASAEAQAALAQAQSGATMYRTGTMGSNMAGESQYWSLQNPLTSPGYASQMGVPGGVPNFVLSGTLNPSGSVITNEAAALGSNAGGGIQIVTSPGGVGNLIYTMPYY
jgi:hypothetical protein